MFERILEKIVLSIAGDYIEDFSKENMKVGVWSGNIKVENVKLNPNLLKKLNLPFFIKYSKIKFLNIKIPWKNLSSEPCQVDLDGIYVILNPYFTENIDANFINELNNFFKLKNQELLKYISLLKENIKTSLNEKNENDGTFLSGLITKVIDNIQINISNIHFRIEYKENEIYKSCGFTLKNLSVFTCDNQWDKKFFIRKETMDTLFKKLKIDNFDFYWNSNENLYLSNYEDTVDIDYKMYKLIKDTNNDTNMNYLINFSTIGKLVINPKINLMVNQNIPFYELKVIFEENNIELFKKQFNDIMKFSSRFFKHNEKMKKNNEKFIYISKKPWKYIRDSENEIEKKTLVIKWFQYLIKLGTKVFSKNQIINTKKPINLRILNKSEKHRFIKIFNSIQNDYLGDMEKFKKENNDKYSFYMDIVVSFDFEYIKNLLKKYFISKEAKEKIKEKNNKGWFSNMFANYDNNTDNNDIKDEIKDLESSIQINLKESMVNYPDSYFYFKMNLFQEKFNINLKLLDENSKDIKTINFVLKNLSSNLAMKINGINFDLKIEDLQLFYKEKNHKENDLKFFYKINGNENLIIVNYEDKPNNSEKEDNRIKLEINKSDFIYSDKIVNMLKILFENPNLDNEFKNAIKNQASINIKRLQNISENRIMEIVNAQKKTFFEIYFNSPNIIMPLDQDLNEYFLLKPGELNIIIKTYNSEDVMYDKILFNLNNMNIKLISKINKDVNILNDIDLKINLSKLKNILHEIKNNNFKYKFDLFLDNIEINLNYDIINKVNYLISKFFILNKTVRMIKNISSKDDLLEVIYKDNNYLGLYEDKLLYLVKTLKDDTFYGYINLKNNKYTIHNNFIKINDLVIKFPNKSKMDSFIKDLNKETNNIYKFINDNIQFYIGNLDNKTIFNSWKEKLNHYNDYFNNLKIIDDIIYDLKMDLKFNGFKINYVDDINNNYEICCKDFGLDMDITNTKTYWNFKWNDFYFKIIKKHISYYVLTTDINQAELYSNSSKNDLKKQQFINIELNLLSKFSKEFKENKNFSNINIIIGSIYGNINFSDIYNKFFHLRNIFYNEINKIVVSETFNNSNKQTYKYENMEQEIITDFILDLKIASIELIAKANDDKKLAKICTENLHLNIISKYGSMKLDWNIEDINLFDLTNYPNYEENLSNENIIQNHLIKKKDKNNNKAVFNLYIEIFDENLYEIKNQTCLYIIIDLCNLKLFYHQQLVLRYINFILIEFMPILFSLIDNKQNKTIHFLENITNPLFNDIKIIIKDCEIYLQKDNNDKLFCYLDIDNAIVQSKYDLSKSRIKKNINNENKLLNFENGVYESSYIINIYNVKIINSLNGNKNNLLNPFDVEIKVNLLLFEEYYKEFYNYNNSNLDYELVIDNSIIVDVHTTSLFLNFGNLEYNSIMYYLYNFIISDDKREKYFKFNNILKLEKINIDENSFIHVNILIDNIGIILLENEDNIDIIPIGKIFLNNLNIYIYWDNFTTNGEIKFNKIIGYYLEYNNNSINECGFIEDFNQINKYNEDEINTLFYKNINFEFNKDNKNNFFMNFSIKKFWKKFELNLKDVKILLIPKILWQIYQIFNINRNVKLGSNNINYNSYIKDIIKFEGNFNNFSILVLNDNKNNCLSSTNNIKLNYNSFNSLNKIDFEKLEITNTKKTNLFNNSEYKLKYNLVQEITIEIDKLEIFLCNFEEYVSINNLKKNKRSLMLPCNFIFEYKNYRPFNFVKDWFDNYNEMNIILNKILLNISIKDLECLNEILNYNSYNLDNYYKEVEKKNLKNINKKNIKEENPKDLSSTDSVIKFEVKENIKMILINDTSNIKTPMINFIVSEINFINVINITSTYEMYFKFDSFYFNSKSNIWEPFIEDSYFKFMYLNIDNNISQIEFQLDELKYSSNLFKEPILNINISDELLYKINILQETYYNLKKKTKKYYIKKTQNLKLKNEKINRFNGISNTIIINQTGYPINIQNMIKKYEFNSLTNEINEEYLFKGEKLIIDGNSSNMIEFNEVNFDNQNVFHMITFNLDKSENKEIKINEDVIKRDKINYNKKSYEIIYIIRNYEDLRKIIISSPIIFKNITNKHITIEIIQNKSNLSFNPNEIIGIPIDCVNKNFEFMGHIEKYNYYFYELKHKKIRVINLIDSENKKFYIIIYTKTNIYNANLNEIFIIPPLIFKNYLPIEIILLVSDNEKTKEIKLKKNQKLEIYDINVAQNIKFQVKIENFKSKNNILLINDGKFKKTKKILLNGDDGSDYSIKFIYNQTENLAYYFKIYCDFIIINSSDIPVNIFNYENKNKKLINQTSNGLYMVGNSKSKIGISLKEDKSYKYIHIVDCEGINKSGSIKFKNNNTIFELGYQLLLVSNEDNISINTKILDIVPKNIFCNLTKYKIFLNMGYNTEKIVNINTHIPIFKFSNIDKVINLTLEIDNSYYKQLDYINLNKIGNYINFIFSEDRKNYKIINTDIILNNDIFYTKVELLNESLIKINNITDKKIIIYQIECENIFYQLIEPNNEVDYAWISNNKKLILCVDILNNNNNDVVDRFLIDFNKDYNKINIKNKYLIKTKIIKNSRIIIISNKTEKKIQSSVKINETQFKFNLKNIGVSLISYKDKTRLEYFYLKFNDLNLLYYYNIYKTIYQIKLKNFQVDSNFTPYTRYPIFLTANKLKELKENKDLSFLNCIIEFNNSKSERINIINNIKIDIIPFNITADQQLVIYSLQLYNNYCDSLKIHSMNYNYYHHLFGMGHNSIKEWEKVENTNEFTQWIFIGNLFIQSLKINVTFNLNDKIKELTWKDLNIINLLVETIGVTIINIDEADLHIDGIIFTNLFKTQEGLYSLIYTIFSASLKRQLFKIIGSLEVIGNPAQLIGNVGSGIHNFFSNPIQGFVKGPLEGVIGIKKGTVSLVKNTISSTFNTISKITGSIGSGLSVLSFDSEYKKKRELLKQQKPDHVFDGLNYGFKAIGKGIWDGVSGIVKNPIQGAKNDGAKGFFKGILTGITGVVAKPITSIFDATSLTAEGIKRTFRYFDDKANEIKNRIPRVFYGYNQFFKIYNKKDSFIIKLLFSKYNNKYVNDIYFNSFISFKNKKIDKIYIITYQNLLIVNFKYEIVYSICIENILKILKHDENKILICDKINKNVKILIDKDLLKNFINDINFICLNN